LYFRKSVGTFLGQGHALSGSGLAKFLVQWIQRTLSLRLKEVEIKQYSGVASLLKRVGRVVFLNPDKKLAICLKMFIFLSPVRPLPEKYHKQGMDTSASIFSI
jgi:hypothetical protein